MSKPSKPWTFGTKIDAFKVVSVGVTLLSLYTFVYNCVRVDYNPPLHTFWALVQSALGVGFFGAGVWWDRPWLRYIQLAMMLLVAFTTLNFNTNPWMGLFFLFTTVAVSFGYDVYDRGGGWKVAFGVVVVYLGILIVYRDPVKSLLTFLGFGVASGLVGYILWDKVRRWKAAYVETHDIARESLELNRQQLKESEHGRTKH